MNTQSASQTPAVSKLNWKKLDAATESLLEKAEVTYVETDKHDEDPRRDVRAAADILQAPLREALEEIHGIVQNLRPNSLTDDECVRLNAWLARFQDDPPAKPEPLPPVEYYEAVRVMPDGELMIYYSPHRDVQAVREYVAGVKTTHPDWDLRIRRIVKDEVAL